MKARDRNPERVSEPARALHHHALVFDAHADTPTEFFLLPDYDFGERHDTGHIDLPRLREGGIDAQFLIAWVPPEKTTTAGACFAHSTQLITAIHEVVGRTPGIRLVTDAAGLRTAHAAGDVAALIGVEGGHAIEGSLERLAELHERGVRYLTLTWNNTNEWADACCSPPRHGGLSAFGRDVVRTMNRLGMIVDVSHVADTTFYHALETSTRPVIASHSCARALTNHPRNLTDEQLRSLAAHGGVVGLNFFPAFLDGRIAEAYPRIEAETVTLAARLAAQYQDAERAQREANIWKEARWQELPRVTMETLMRHLDHLVEVAGPDHVGLGSDFDGIKVLPEGIRDAADYPVLTALMLERGYDDSVVRKILGENLLRVLAENEG